jgi:hypothetical protein
MANFFFFKAVVQPEGIPVLLVLLVLAWQAFV